MVTASPSVAGHPSTTTRVRVRYAETDKMGVVYYANYFVWFEVGRCELLRSLGWNYRELEESGITLPVIDATCRYHRSSYYDDELNVLTRGSLLSPVRMAFDYEIVRESTRDVVVTGRTVHAAINATGKPCRLPHRLRSVFA